jgi:hypothetical protein
VTTILDDLHKNGLAPLYQSLPPHHATHLAAHLRASPCYPGHVRVYGDGLPRPYHHLALSPTVPVFCTDLASVLAAPHLWELVQVLFPVARAYLGADAHVYSLNAFWSNPSPLPPVNDLQTFHRDRDDTAFLTLFVYGTDVLSADDGPHVYQLGTHLHNDLPDPPHGRVYGPAGTAFLADTRGLHLGVPPTRDPRLLVWARWGVSPRPWAYENDRLEPVPARILGSRLDSNLRNAVRLVISDG